jgi:hypothetical protein
VDIAAGERLPLERLLSQSLPRRSLAVLGGMFSFVDARSRAELLPASPELAVVLRLDENPLPDLSLLFDVSGSGGEQRLHLSPGAAAVPFTYTSLSVGAAVPYTWRFDRLSLYAGPRVAALYLQRSFQTEAFSGTQNYFTVSPGVVGGVVWRLNERLELTSQLQMMMTYVVVDGQGQAVGFSGGWAGVGYRF